MTVPLTARLRAIALSVPRWAGLSRSQGRSCMALVLGVCIVGALLIVPALAQQGNSGLFWQCQAPSSAHPSGGYCPASTTYPLPVTSTSSGSAITIVVGTQVALSIATATALTVPATATIALVQAQGTNNSSGVCLYWQDDGTNPTASAGQQLAAQASVFYEVTSLPIKLIAATGASCTATISYYK